MLMSLLCLYTGVHVTLPDYYSPEHLGMIVPKTKDGRVVFMLPWLDATIAGTTGLLRLQTLLVQFGLQPHCRGCCIAPPNWAPAHLKYTAHSYTAWSWLNTLVFIIC